MMSNSSRSIPSTGFQPEGRAFNYNGDETFISTRFASGIPPMLTVINVSWRPPKHFQKGFVELADKPFLHFTDMLKVAPD